MPEREPLAVYEGEVTVNMTNGTVMLNGPKAKVWLELWCAERLLAAGVLRLGGMNPRVRIVVTEAGE